MKKNIKKIKKMVTLVLTMIFLTILVGCTSDKDVETDAVKESAQETSGNQEGAETPSKQYVIGVAEAQATYEVTKRREYYENYIGPKYNVKFIFSEMLKDDMATKEFIENCIDMGADAIIDFKSQNSTMAKLCEDNGLIYVINNAKAPVNADLYEGCSDAFVGGILAEHAYSADLFSKWLRETASEDGSEGFLIASVIAANGNKMHYEITKGLLETLQDMYGLTYEEDIEAIVLTTEPIFVKNDKDIEICVFPGSTAADTWLNNISPILQSGKYGIFISPGETFNNTANLIDEIERSLGIDIKVAAQGSASEDLVKAMETTDCFGNPSVDFVISKATTELAGPIFALAYNGLTNGADCLYVDGLPKCYEFHFFAVDSADAAKSIYVWDNGEESNWVEDTSIIDQLLFIKNQELTPESFESTIQGLTYEVIYEKMK